MKMLTQHNPQTSDSSSLSDIIKEIETKSGHYDCIYRGEPECYDKVSSVLYREYAHIGTESLDLEAIQRKILNEAKKHTYAIDDSEILIEIQHYGGRTNLIDFTTNHLIALFFACDGAFDKDGRIVLQKTELIKDLIKHPRNPRHRVKVQETVFVIPPNGFIEPDKEDIVTIPAALKRPLLQHLRKQHNISTETIYNDLYSFIKNQNIHRNAYVSFYSGFTFQNTGDKSETPEGRQAAYEKAIAYYTASLEQKPDLLEAYVNLGIVYNDIDEIDKAFENYNKAIQLDPNYMDAYNNRGVAYLRKGDFDNAIQDYSTVIQLNPNYTVAYYNRGNAYLHKNESERAIADYTQAIELNSDDAEAHTGRGVAYFKTSEVDLAIKDYSRAIQLKSDYAIAYYNRGNAYHKQGEYDRAIGDYNTTIQLDPDYAEAYYSRGNAYGKKGKTDFAINDYTQAIELNSDYAEAYNNRGIIYGEQGKYDFAMEDFTKAIRLTPGNFNAYYNLGRVYDEKGEYNQAIENYDKVIELNPGYVSAYYGRGVAWLHLQEWEKAKADLTTARGMGVDIALVFRNNFGSVENFERINGIQLPEDLAALLTPP